MARLTSHPARERKPSRVRVDMDAALDPRSGVRFVNPWTGIGLVLRFGRGVGRRYALELTAAETAALREALREIDRPATPLGDVSPATSPAEGRPVPFLRVYLSVETMTALIRHAEERGRNPMDLAECAISEAVLAADRGRVPATPPGDVSPPMSPAPAEGGP